MQNHSIEKTLLALFRFFTCYSLLVRGNWRRFEDRDAMKCVKAPSK